MSDIHETKVSACCDEDCCGGLGGGLGCCDEDCCGGGVGGFLSLGLGGGSGRRSALMAGWLNVKAFTSSKSPPDSVTSTLVPACPPAGVTAMKTGTGKFCAGAMAMPARMIVHTTTS